jgi:hypothetical protein
VFIGGLGSSDAIEPAAPWLCVIEAAKRMTDGSCIINITDTGVEKNWTGYGPYLVSKSGWTL